ncbi:hydroxysteroid dehydrogenase-like protein 1 [Neocloeon triangulifer]|uniref:hydroxysteroid dehydrogenase-like protein 1 n=1 Tax=Neocloeon triangulifer TaxID=2078957 RepID=UPI00286F7532|nr:hydroxysteroid dehydrogenase-like protein 1 [Neocloeon triangulifer]
MSVGFWYQSRMELIWILYNIIALICILIVAIPLIIRGVLFLHVFLISRIFYKKKDFTKCFGEWAVVTGGSDGIGKNFAIELAKRKVNVVLISNVQEDLKKVANEIECNFGVKTRTIVADFSLGEEEYQRIESEIKDLSIGILVNNVGIGLGLPNKFEDMTRQEMWNMLRINVCAAVSMAHFLLPSMKTNGKGLIVNIASASALLPAPYVNLYGASKAFIKSFSEALRYECRKTGVKVQTLCPCFVNTRICSESNARKQLKLLFPTPEKFVKSAVATIGVASTTTGYWPHEIQYIGVEMVLPKWIGMKLMMLLMNTNLRKVRKESA